MVPPCNAPVQSEYVVTAGFLAAFAVVVGDGVAPARELSTIRRRRPQVRVRRR